ncbi:NOC3L [Hepatospora eriocheir]|uniref:NOC3L n=1 Tax=Hepatospora eriocheir TaxID=1081669 RepID=A0A1X0QKR2_9MICR|nr:NOC3L [Hepatospora eriocheir]
MDLIRVGDVCEKIINNPEENIELLAKLVEIDDPLILLALGKLFKNICPLYKIRVHSNKIKHKNADLEINKTDKVLLGYYNKFLKTICNSQLAESYKTACILLESLDHFNFNDRLVSKVLLGTTKHGISDYCVNTLVDRIKFDEDSIHLILDSCLDYKFGPQICDVLHESSYLNKCVQMRIDKEEKYLKKQYERPPKMSKEEKKFFGRKFLKGKMKKEEKCRLILQKETRKEEKNELDCIDDKIYVKTINALQRLIFTVLKEKRTSCLMGVFKAVRTFKRIIRKEFYEGLQFLLNENIQETKSIDNILEGVNTIISVFGESNYDLRISLNKLYQVARPFNPDLSDSQLKVCCNLIRELFILRKESKNRSKNILARLLVLSTFIYSDDLDKLVKEITNLYDIDVTDSSLHTSTTFETDIDNSNKVSFICNSLRNKRNF